VVEGGFFALFAGIFRRLLANPAISSSRLSESNEGRDTSLSKRGLRQPGCYSHYIERGGNQQMKQPSLGQTNVARAPQIPHPNAL
jgi:hypothetical protein